MPAEGNPFARFGPDEERVDRRHRGVSVGRRSFSTALKICRDTLEEEPGLEFSTESCRSSVAAFATQAHRQDIPPERALAVFKDMLFQLTAFRRVPPDRRIDVMRRLVKTAIDAYYGGHDG
ncbi:MAG TPA: hypothetical protein VIF32_05930 [Gemmatimonadaceae bacterium]